MALELISKRPGKSDNGLAQSVIKYKSDKDADATMAEAPDLYSAHPTLSGLYLMEASADETGPKSAELELVYHGAIGGSLPAAKNSVGRSVQQARYTSVSGKTWVQITYRAKTATKLIYSGTVIDPDAIGAPTPVDAEVIWYLAMTTEGATLPTSPAEALTYFSQIIVPIGDAEDLVPGHYYRGRQTNNAMLFSLGL